MLTITPFLWFDTQAEEAMNFYASIFPLARIVGDRVQGQVMSVEFELEGQRFMGLNAGPHHKFNEAVSFFVPARPRPRSTAAGTKLLAGGGRPGRCGWLKDKFGLSWQIIPRRPARLLADPDPAKAKRAMDAMLQMEKLDMDVLVAAFKGEWNLPPTGAPGREGAARPPARRRLARASVKWRASSAAWRPPQSLPNPRRSSSARRGRRRCARGRRRPDRCSGGLAQALARGASRSVSTILRTSTRSTWP